MTWTRSSGGGVAGHSVQNACRLLEVSSPPITERRNAPPRPHARDADLLEKIKVIFAESKGPMAPRGSTRSFSIATSPAEAQGDQLMRQAGLEAGARNAGAPPPSPTPTPSGARPHSAPLRPCEEIDLRYVGDITYIGTWEVGLPGHGHRPGQPPDLAGPGRSHAHRAGPRRPHHGVRQQAPEEASFFIRTGAVNTRAGLRRAGPANGVVLSVGRKGECWDNVVAESFFATIKRGSSTPAPGRRERDFDAPFSSTSRAGTTRGRLHSTLGSISPAQYEAVRHNADRQAA